MREIRPFDRAVYSGLCAVNLVLLSVTCWLMSRTAFFIIGAFVLAVCEAIDLVLVAIRAETVTACWHTFMALMVTMGTLAMSIYTGIYCTNNMDDECCSYMIGTTVMGAVICTVEVGILIWGKRVGYAQAYHCCLPKQQVNPASTLVSQATTHKPKSTTKAVVFVVPLEHIEKE